MKSLTSCYSGHTMQSMLVQRPRLIYEEEIHYPDVAHSDQKIFNSSHEYQRLMDTELSPRQNRISAFCTSVTILG